MPQSLVAGYLPEDFDPSRMDEATGRALPALHKEMIAAGVTKLACGLGAAKSLRGQADGGVLITDGPIPPTWRLMGESVRRHTPMNTRRARLLAVALSIVLISCSRGAPMKPDFDEALQNHLASIETRDIEAFKGNLTLDETLYTVVQNGHAFTKKSELIAIHEEWFRDPDWVWKGEVVHKVVGADMAMALVRYQYQARPAEAPFSTWLIYVFQLQDGKWRIVHDQSTALDYAAFAQSAGIEVK